MPISNVTITLKDKEGDACTTGYETTDYGTPLLPVGQLEVLDSLTHAQIIGAQVSSAAQSGDTIKTSPTAGTFSDKNYRLNLSFRDDEGKVRPWVIRAPKAKVGGDNDFIYVIDEDGVVPPVLPDGANGLAGEELARKFELYRGLTANSCTFISGKIKKPD